MDRVGFESAGSAYELCAFLSTGVGDQCRTQRVVLRRRRAGQG